MNLKVYVGLTALGIASLNCATMRHAEGAKEARPQGVDACPTTPAEFGPCLTNWSLSQVQEGKADRAKEYLLERKKALPDAAGPDIAVSFLFLQANDTNLALEHARTALSLEPRNPFAMYAAARALFAHGNRDAAKLLLENALEIAPDDASLRLWHGHVLRLEGQTAEAFREYERAVELRRDVAEAWMHYGLLLLEQGKTSEAENALQQAHTLKPNSAVILANLAKAYYKNNHISKAMAAYRQALKLDEQLDEVYFNMALLLQEAKLEGRSQLEQLEEAKQSFETFLAKGKHPAGLEARVKHYVSLLAQKIEIEKRRELEAKQPKEAPKEEQPKEEQPASQGAQEGQ